MPSVQAKLIASLLQLRPYGWAKGTIAQQRSRQEKSARQFKIPKGVMSRPVQIQGISAEWIAGADTKGGVILYLHGGAYALGSANVHKEYLSRLALASQLQVLAINYRLAPEDPFPAALEDSLAAYSYLLSQGYAPSQICIAGDSAGAGLALASLLALRDAGEPLPACAVCISPWADLTLSGDSIQKNAAIDPILNVDILAQYAKDYSGTYEKSAALISPLFADLQGLPPLLIHVGDREILLDDANRLFDKAKRAGVDVSLETWEGLFHVFQIIPFIPETIISLEHISRFVQKHCL